MVCTANDLLRWSDFPKGLRVLLLSHDSLSSSEIESRLQQMDYSVFKFCDENEALEAISNKPDGFHIAIVEVSSENSHGVFNFLQAAKDLPTIMTSNERCLSTMMKCIALGAVEFLLKPLSDDKLKNLWQHVVHKAFNPGERDLPESLKPVKESVHSMLNLQPENEVRKRTLLIRTVKNDIEHSMGSDKYPAPLTLQLKQGVRLVEDGDCQDQTNCSTEKEHRDQSGESKFVDTTCCDIVNEVTTKPGLAQSTGDSVVKDEDRGPDSFKNDSNSLSRPNYKNGLQGSTWHDSCGKKANRKKMKVDWTPDLHKKFVRAVEKLGMDQAVPSRILEMMKVEGLTRHNIASHLQKYRKQRRHILPREDDMRWRLWQRSYHPQRPFLGHPPYHHPKPANRPIHSLWGPHGCYPGGLQVWAPAFYPPWQPTENWQRQPHPGMHADMWGCPVMLQPYGPCPSIPQLLQNVNGLWDAGAVHGSYNALQDSFDFLAEEEVADKVIKEAISQPWLPLPIGLNPPSTESVLAELSKQGISAIPPTTSVAALKAGGG